MEADTGIFSHIVFAARTDVGKRRKNNEDAFGTFPSAGVFCVADGMGGGADGEVASAATVKAVEDCVRMMPQPLEGGYPAEAVAERVADALSGASEWLWRRSKEKKIEGSGSTYVGVVFDPVSPGRAIAMHAGDSRLYIIHGKKIRQVTRDHSAIEMFDEKDERRLNPMFSSMIVNAVGIRQSVDVEYTEFRISAGDRVLICSDGLSRMVEDKDILAISRGNASVDDAADSLIAAALAAGGVDNVTLVLCEMTSIPPSCDPVDIPSPEMLDVPEDDAETCDPEGDDTQTGGGATSQTAFTPSSPASAVRRSSVRTPVRTVTKRAPKIAFDIVALVLVAVILLSLLLWVVFS